jgi:hypothetical protein
VDDQERKRRLNNLQRQLGDVEEDERTWGMKMSSLTNGTAEYSEIRALGGSA